jgi:hypothetical protein
MRSGGTVSYLRFTASLFAPLLTPQNSRKCSPLFLLSLSLSCHAVMSGMSMPTMQCLMCSHRTWTAQPASPYKPLCTEKWMPVSTCLMISHPVSFMLQRRAIASTHVPIHFLNCPCHLQVYFHSFLQMNRPNLNNEADMIVHWFIRKVYDKLDCTGEGEVVDLSDYHPAVCMSNVLLSCEENPKSKVENWWARKVS